MLFTPLLNFTDNLYQRNQVNFNNQLRWPLHDLLFIIMSAIITITVAAPMIAP